MAGIVKKIEIFNQAFKIAWSKISEDAKLTPVQRSEAANSLRDAFQAAIKTGRTDAQLIAFEAMTDIHRTIIANLENHLPDKI